MDERNATGSWSGYLHQGKVGILIGLQKINELIMNRNDLNDWNIEYESAEDIDIKNSDKVISRHQVKAYKSAKYPNDYKDVLGVLTYEMHEERRVVKTKGFQIHGFDEFGNSLPTEVDENSRYLHTITDTLGFELSKEEFEKKYQTAKYIDNPNKIKLFVYPDGKKYCELSSGNEDKLKVFCIKEIKKILDFSGHIFKDNEEQQNNIYYALVNALDIEIRKKHILGEGFYPILSFSDIYKIVTSTEKYVKSNIVCIREKFAESWTIFIKELAENSISYDCLQAENVAKITEEIYKWDDDRFVQFLKDINPNENAVTMEDITKVCKIDNLKDNFFWCLLFVEEAKFHTNYLGYKEDGGYLLTLINRKPALVKSVMKNICNNNELSHTIFDRNYLINNQINGISFRNIIDNTVKECDKENAWKGRATENDKFINPDMKFISVDQTIEKLNGRKKGC